MRVEGVNQANPISGAAGVSPAAKSTTRSITKTDQTAVLRELCAGGQEGTSHEYCRTHSVRTADNSRRVRSFDDRQRDQPDADPDQSVRGPRARSPAARPAEDQARGAGGAFRA